MPLTTDRHRTTSTRQLCSAIAAAALVVFASITQAADANPAKPDLIDLNGDGRISYQEFVHSMTAKALRELDQEKKGYLTPTDLVPSAGNPRNESIVINHGKADSDGDGKLSHDELAKELAAHPDVRTTFRNLDRDTNGELSEPEWGSLRVLPQIRIEY